MKKEKVREIIREEYQELLLEQAKSPANLSDMLDAALDQMNQHAELMKEITYYLTAEEDESELAKEFVKAHGRYARVIKEVKNSID